MTSLIASKVQSVSALRFQPMPTGKKVDAVKACRIGRTHVFVDTKGNIYSTQVQNKAYYTLGTGLDDTLKACGVLGLISKQAADQHIADVETEKAKSRKRWAAVEMLANATTLGLRLTAAQKKAIEAAGGMPKAEGGAA